MPPIEKPHLVGKRKILKGIVNFVEYKYFIILMIFFIKRYCLKRHLNYRNSYKEKKKYFSVISKSNKKIDVTLMLL